MKQTTRTVVLTLTETVTVRDYPSSRPMPAAPAVIETTGEELHHHARPGVAKVTKVVPLRKVAG